MRLVYREKGSAGQTLFEVVECDALEFLPLSDGVGATPTDRPRARVLLVNPLEVASVTVDGAEVQKPSVVAQP